MMVGLILFMVFDILSVTAQASSACDQITGAQLHNGKCLLLVSTTKNWNDAKDHCSDLPGGGTLVEVRSDNDAEGLRAFLESVGNNDGWAGAFSTQNNANTFVWVSDQAPVDNRFWEINPPAHDCAEYKKYSKPLATKDCNQRNQFVCQHVVADVCDDIFPGSQLVDDKCFKFFDTELAWHDAQKACHQMNAILAEPNTDSLKDGLIQLARDKFGSVQTLVWLGATDENTEGTFRWIEADEDVNNNWAIGEPSGAEQGNHIALYRATRSNSLVLGWMDLPSTYLTAFVCQRDASSSATFNYVIVVPKMDSDLAPQTRTLQISSSSTNHVYVTIVKFTPQGGRIVEKVVVSSTKSIDYQLDYDLEMNTTGTHHRYVEVKASNHVTVLLFCKGQTGSGSTLILPNDFLPNSGVRRTAYFVHPPSVSQSSASLLAIVSLQDAQNDITIYFLQPIDDNETYGGVTLVREMTMAEATLHSKYETMYLDLNVSLHGHFIYASGPVSIFTASAKVDGDYVIESVLPLELIGTEYVTFQNPLSPPSSDNLVAVVAVYDNTIIEVTQGGTTMDITLESAGDYKTITLDADQLSLLQGNNPFYAYEYCGFQAQNDRQCVTSLTPRNLWRFQYQFEMTSFFSGFDVYFIFVLDLSLNGGLFVNDGNKGIDWCTHLNGTSYASCAFKVSGNTPQTYHFKTEEYRSTFGAYMYANTQDSALCNTLGVTASSSPTHVFDHQAFISRLQNRSWNNCDTPLSETTTEATTSKSRDLTTVEETTIEWSSMTNEGENTTEDPTTNVYTTSDSIQPTTTDHQLVTNKSPNMINLTSEEILQLTSDLRDTLLVNAAQLSASKRKKISVPDKRASAVTIGSAGLGFLITTAVLLIAPDILGVCRWAARLLKRKRKNVDKDNEREK